MTRRPPADARPGFTLIEMLVVFGVVAVLAALLVPAVQRAREAAARASCQNNLKQLALALHQYHNVSGAFPSGWRSAKFPRGMSFSGWELSVLPYLEQAPLYAAAQTSYAANPNPLNNPLHAELSVPLKVFACPSDARTPGPQVSLQTQTLAALTSYLGVCGQNYSSQDGVLFPDSQVRLGDITDGTSMTLMLGERPPSADMQFGWWYAGAGQNGTGSADLILGVHEANLLPILPGSPCGPGTYTFSNSQFTDPCGMFHFWSPHTGGANFAFADGSVRYLGYTAAPLMPALASRAGGELAVIPD
jgi:prepilin-type processing-associated H-X9-DG protein/prepilin-type N-terminal cleavage/methylation domain-containing protein